MMRNNVMKDMRFLLVVVAMLMTTLFVPWEAHAVDSFDWTNAQQHDVSTETVEIKDCGICKGHIITGKSTQAMGHNIVVIGSHNIKLQGVEIETAVSPGNAFAIVGKGNVEVTLEGSNSLHSGAGAGMSVPHTGYLTIDGDGSLDATGGDTGAGIGGQSSTNAGTIVIKSGTISAKGGEGAAGIGGGSGGNAGTVRIEGGTVKAVGGDSTSTTARSGGSGIGRGVFGSGGTVIITGGKEIKAIGGMSYLTGLSTPGYGINASTLSSNNEKNKDTRIIAQGQGTGVSANTAGFNGIIGNGQSKNSSRYIVYGDAELSDPWLKVDGGQVEISEGASLTLDTNSSNQWSLGKGGMITGSGTLYNDQMILDGSFGPDVLTYPRYIKDDMVPKKIADQEYTGEEIEPDVVIKDGKGGSITLKRGEHYNLTYADNIEVGIAKMYVRGIEPNYLDEDKTTGVVREFNIVPAKISRIEMSVSPDEAVYNGKKQNFDITVTDGTHILSAKDDYDVEYDENADFVNAGEIGVTIKGKGNYTGTVKKTLTIKPKPIDITNAAASDRDYDGTREVTMTEVRLDQDDILEGDTIKVDMNGLAGTIANADVGEYDTVTLDPDNIKLIDENGKETTNYVARLPVGNLYLDPPVTISKLKHGTPVATGKSEASRRYEDKFACRITVEDPKPGATYLYRQGVEGEEQESNYFDNLDVNQWYTFVVRVEDNHNVEAPKEPDDQYLVRVYVDKLDQEPPEPFQIDFKKNEDGTSYTATMPEKENVLYSFDGGQTWLTLESGGNIKTNCEPGHPYVGQMKYVEDATHKESEPRVVEATAPMEQVKPPTISPNGGEFKGSQLVTMTCETRDAVIYYTLDGSDPQVDGDEVGEKTKRYTKPFEITDAANIKAIATKEYMQNSRSTSAKFELDDSLETRVTKTDLSKVEIPSSLREVGYTSISDITAALSRVLTAHSGYTYQNIAYYDITVMVSNDRKTWREAKLEDFPDDGLTITVPYPTGTTKTGNDFIAAHMFTATDTRLGIEAGDIEEPTVTKTAKGIEMKIKGTSPLGVAWKAAAADNTNSNTTANNGSNGSNDANGANGTAARAQANSDNSNNGTDRNGNGTDEDGNGSTADGAGNGSDSSSSSAENGGGLASLLPQTSDGRTILLWVVLALLSAAILGGLKVKRKKN